MAVIDNMSAWCGKSARVVTVAVGNRGDEIRTGTLKATIRQSGLPEILFRE